MKTRGLIQVRGHVVFTVTDDEGRVIQETEADNSFTDGYVSALVQHMSSGGTPALPLTHLSVGCGGFLVAACDSASGWSTAPTLDTTLYKVGSGSLKVTQTASTNGTYGHATLTTAKDATGGYIEAWIRLGTRANFDLTNSKVRILSGSSAAKGYEISLSAIEALPTGAFTDSTWKIVKIPVASFTPFGASPSWTTVTGMAMVVYANANGSAVINWDDVREVPASWPVTAAATAVADERSKKALTSLTYTAPLTLTAKAYWTAGELPGDWHIAGLWGGSGGATLAAIVAAEFAKLAGFNLTITWTLTFAGG